ncbi:MAG: hypothetical protein KF873_22270 [Gemmataceae bacterium]|nr:hypothetical protein [Gemmataceae bacterium]
MFRPLFVFLVLACGSTIRADDAADPLRRIPVQAGFVFKIENPRLLVESVSKIGAYHGLEQFPQARELLESTPVKRFFQTVRHLEKELGAPWPELLDKVAGRGIAIGVAIDKEPQPAVLVLEGTDEATVAKAHAMFLDGLREELARGDAKQELKTKEFQGAMVSSTGKEFFTARIGPAIYIANRDAAMLECLKLAAGKGGTAVANHPTLVKAKALAGPNALAWGWLDFAKVKESQQSKDFFATTKKDIFQTMLFGSTADAARRAEFIAFALEQTPKGYSWAVRLPAKRSELDPNMAIHAPFQGEPGSRPLLRPAGVLFSQSMYLDLGYLWKERKRIFNPENLKDLENGIAQIDKVLPNTTFGQLLENSGPYHRFVAAHTGEKLYGVEPSQAIPPSAYVGSMRDAQYGESMEALLRAGGLIAGFQTGWKMSEETFDGVKLVSYRFSEKVEPKFDDPEKLRFNAVPTFAIVGDSLIVGSTPGIVKLLIPELRKESKASGSPAVWRASAFAGGGAKFLESNPEATVTQAILSQGIGLAEAKEQTKKLAAWLGTLGRFDVSIDHAAEFFEFKIAWNTGN